MKIAKALDAAWSSRAIAMLRIVSGYLFLLHGSAKLLHIPHIAQFDKLQLFSLIGMAGVLELAGGFLLVTGFLTRPVAFLLSGEMAFAYFTVHSSVSTMFLPLLNRGEPAVLYCFIFLFLAVSGGGAYSIDSLLSRKNRQQQ